MVIISPDCSGRQASESSTVKFDLTSSSLAVCIGNHEIQIRDANDLHLNKR